MDTKYHYRTVEDDIIVNQLDSPEIVDDFELGQDEAVDIEDVEVNKQKLRRRIDQYKIELKNPCRPGKKLLVLDIDYTLFDHRSTAETPLELMRPYLHEFLTAVYAEYDIMIWSATRNFMMNLQNGLVISPFRKAHANRDNDLELVKLAHYLLAIADLDDLSVLDHKIWEFFAEELSDVPE
ncbi:hypothetical protein SADUNF_Sadunf03G0007700 [Salix dunnii]|uniref:FCP1 homology domain-containing protein n=1 Tax=Salix dunnii TaxID=1413687 RepID=A0A835KFG4_9ROSI|nr:hypothetical protein SADUNF_Sadunf03G0007700 [Salix dunnii]